MQGYKQMSRHGIRRDVIAAAAVFVSCAILTLVEVCLKAFSDHDIIGLMVFAAPFLVCVWLWLRPRPTRDIRTKLVVAIGVLLAHVTLSVVGSDHVEAMVLNTRIHLSKDYTRKCEVAEEIPVDGGKLRVCERRWHRGDELTALIKFDGDTEKLIRGGFNKATSWGRVNMFLPFGVMKYGATPISGDYFLLNFSSADRQ
jgi:hypothetical protein